MTKQRIQRIRRIIQNSRCRLIQQQPFYGLMLMYFQFVAVPDINKITTDGRCIFFDPNYIEKLYDYEMDALLCHQVMHVILGHVWIKEAYESDDYHFACNIFINSLLKEQGILPVRSAHLGELCTTIPGTHLEGKDYSPQYIYENSFYSLSYFDERTKSRYLEDSNTGWSGKSFGEDGILILDIPGEDPILIVGDESKESEEDPKDGPSDGTGNNPKSASGEGKDAKNSAEIWMDRAKTVKNMLLSQHLDDPSDPFGYGNIPGYLQRLFEMKDKPKIDWRKFLNDFIQEQIADYSFNPPDRRFADTGFFLPDFNEKEYITKDILFMVDTSGSVDDETLGRVYTEICSACEQFHGKLSGKLGFFDTGVTDPIPFESVSNIVKILPYGGGGTDFIAIFAYIRFAYEDNMPACLIIFTDGEGPYPTESETMGIPVLWVLDNDLVTPPFGNVIRLIPEQKDFLNED